MSDNTLAKSFEPHTIESHWGPEWEKRGYAAPAFDPARPDFSIQLPPPNVTGTLHMGHAFNQTIMDGLARYHRMLGENTLWVPGTDHAGIATQIVVERQLDAQGVSRHDLGREKFVERVWEWKENPVRRSPARCVASARPPTGRASTSRWTTRCRPPCATCSSRFMNRA
ncbi:tRNA synthetases class I family protein [Burkholderia cepacia]|nr:tRNA synthetases class I family protein [Burkholderia cepacia]